MSGGGRLPPPRRVSHVPYDSFPACCRQYPGEMTSRYRSFDEAIPAFPKYRVGRLPPYVSRGLLSIHSRYGPQVQPAYADSFLVSFDESVALPAVTIATGTDRQFPG